MNKNKDWSGDLNSVYATLGASNHSKTERAEYDFYATPREATEKLLKVEDFSACIWEPAVGGGNISEVLKESGFNVICSDLVERGNEDFLEDFLKSDKKTNSDIITNPPYKYAKEFVIKANELLQENHKIAMLLKLTFLESEGRAEMFSKYPPVRIYVFKKRINCALNGDFNNLSSPAVCYAWFIWEKDNKNLPVINWI